VTQLLLPCRKVHRRNRVEGATPWASSSAATAQPMMPAAIPPYSFGTASPKKPASRRIGLFWAVVALGASGRMRSSAKAGGALSAAMSQIDEILSATNKTAHVYRIEAEDGREAQEDDSGDGPEPGQP
jgi:hypothetical protein